MKMNGINKDTKPKEAVPIIYNNALDDAIQIVENFRKKVRLTNFYNSLFHELIREIENIKIKDE